MKKAQIIIDVCLSRHSLKNSSYEFRLDCEKDGVKLESYAGRHTGGGSGADTGG